MSRNECASLCLYECGCSSPASSTGLLLVLVGMRWRVHGAGVCKVLAFGHGSGAQLKL